MTSQRRSEENIARTNGEGRSSRLSFNSLPLSKCDYLAKIEVKLRDVMVEAILDTGSTINITVDAFAKELGLAPCEEEAINLRVVDGNKVHTGGTL